MTVDVAPNGGHGPCLEKCRNDPDCKEVLAYDSNASKNSGVCCLSRGSMCPNCIMMDVNDATYYVKGSARYAYKGAYGGYKNPTKEAAEKVCASKGYTLCKKRRHYYRCKTKSCITKCVQLRMDRRGDIGWYSVKGHSGCRSKRQLEYMESHLHIGGHPHTVAMTQRRRTITIRALCRISAPVTTEQQQRAMIA